MYIVGITGLAGSGKDTLAKRLKNHYDSNLSDKCQILHFADRLKELCADLVGWDMVLDSQRNEELYTDIFGSGVNSSGVMKYQRKHLHDSFKRNLGDICTTTELFKMLDRFYEVIVKPFSKGNKDCRVFITPRKLWQLVGTEVCRSVRDSVWIDAFKVDANNHIGKCSFLFVPDVRFDNEAAICDIVIGIEREDKTKLRNAGNHVSESGVSRVDFSVLNREGKLAEAVAEVVKTMPNLMAWASSSSQHQRVINQLC